MTAEEFEAWDAPRRAEQGRLNREWARSCEADPRLVVTRMGAAVMVDDPQRVGIPVCGVARHG